MPIGGSRVAWCSPPPPSSCLFFVACVSRGGVPLARALSRQGGGDEDDDDVSAEEVFLSVFGPLFRFGEGPLLLSVLVLVLAQLVRSPW